MNITGRIGTHGRGRDRGSGSELPAPAVTVDGFLVGAWTRSRLVVDGVQCVDRCQALWLQTPDWYADVRMRRRSQPPCDCGPEATLTRPRAFAGTSTWQPPVMTWYHLLDYLGDPITDSIPLERKGDLLIEAGSLRWAGLAIPFREEWRRINRPHDEISAEIGSRRIQITVGAWRILVIDDRPRGPFQASVLTLADGGWHSSGGLIEPGNDDETGRFGPGQMRSPIPSDR
jgi:hypothetical protein